jgi:hypothetical protein
MRGLSVVVLVALLVQGSWASAGAPRDRHEGVRLLPGSGTGDTWRCVASYIILLE